MRTHAYALLGTGTAVAAGALASIVLAGAESQRDASLATTARARVVLAHELPGLDASRLKATLLDVTYAPGGSSAPHTHPCPVVGYVLEGAIRMRVGDQPETVYRAGDDFYEEINAPHLISANASASERARFVAFFTCDREGPLSAPIQDVVR